LREHFWRLKKSAELDALLAELHLFVMSEKELFFRKWRWPSLVLLCLLAALWAVPYGLKWVLVQQLTQALQRDVVVQSVQLNPLSLTLSVHGLSIKNKEGGELAGWQSLTVDVSAQSITQRALVLDALTLQSPRVSVVHLGQGRFDFSDLLDSPKQDSAKTLPPFVLHKVAIHDGRVHLEDRPFQRVHTVEHFKLQLPLVSSMSGKNGLTLTPELSATLNGAPVHVGGTLQPLADAPDGALALTLDAFDLSALQPYVPETLPMRLGSGKLSADLKLQFSEVSERMALLLNGTTQLQDLLLNDARGSALLSFKTLAVTWAPSDVLSRRVVLSNVTLEAPKAAVRINSEGQLNWTAALPAAQPEQSKPTSSDPAFAMQIDQLTMRGGAVDFADESVKPIVQSRITDMNVAVKNISTQPNTQADVAIKANLGAAAPLDVQARLQPLNVTTFLEAKVQAKQVDLTHFSGYAQKCFGYPLEKGKLSIEASYRIKDKQLQADNHVWIDHLTLGEQVPSPHAIDAPVSLGVSLLKDSSGKIDINLPVAGSVDAPEFSFGALVAQTIGNVLVKVVTAPVRAIGSLLGGDEKED
jgi:uncharacterized protein involved in outer membrane biogenesis